MGKDQFNQDFYGRLTHINIYIFSSWHFNICARTESHEQGQSDKKRGPR